MEHRHRHTSIFVWLSSHCGLRCLVSVCVWPHHEVLLYCWCILQGLIMFSRLGVYLRLPGVDVERFQSSMQGGGLLGYIDALSGGSISKVGVFSLGKSSLICLAVLDMQRHCREKCCVALHMKGVGGARPSCRADMKCWLSTPSLSHHLGIWAALMPPAT